jgi:hypothetical protein
MAYSYAKVNQNWLQTGIDRELLTIDYENLVEDRCDNISVLTNYSQVGSYNWSEDEKGVMIIPGAPRIFRNLNHLFQLKKNVHEQMVDENRYHQAEYPLESLFRAVKLCTPELDYNNIDFVTDRNNLRKLFNFVDKSADKSFRIDFQKIGNFIVLIRNEEKTKEICNDYGKDFEEKVTIPDPDYLVQGSHRRVVKYNFGSLKMLVRFEVDCVEKNVTTARNDLCSAISKINLNSALKFPDSQLLYKKLGEFKNNEILMELTTKSNFNNEFPKHKWNQLFFSRTNFLVIGWHQRGFLRNINKYNFNEVTERSGRRTNSTISSLKKLHYLLKKIKKIAADESDDDKKKFSIIFDEKFECEIQIHVCKHDVNGAIPTGLIRELVTQ